MATFKAKMIRWTWNAINAALGGLATGVLTALGVAGTDAISPGMVPPVTLHQFMWICSVSGLISLAMYVRTPEGKLPSLDDTDNGTTATPQLPD